MLNFKKPVLEDKFWIKPILDDFFGLGAENTFGNIFLWADFYNIEVCKCNDFLLKKFSDKDKEFFTFPVGKGDIKNCLKVLFEYCKEKNIEFVFSGLTKKNIDILEEIFPGKFYYLEERGKEDYIYNSYDLIKLKGKKYHSKRNHISKFNRLYDWSFEEISENNLEECKKFCDKWFLENENEKREDIIYEKKAIEKTFKYYKELDFLGGVIKVDGSIVALTCGEKINKYAFDVHFEKALKEYNGAYTVINNEFSKRFLNAFSYINREEDLDILGLRKAKLSYHPVALLRKYKALLR